MITTDITLLLQIINVFILMFLLNKVLYKPVLGILRERSEKMDKMREDAILYKQKADLRQQELDKKMAMASSKAKEALETARAEAAKAGGKEIAEVKAQVEDEKEKRFAELKNQVDAARKNLQENLDDFASDMAGKILGRSL